MKKNQLFGRSFLTLRDFSSVEIAELLALAAKLKRKKRAGKRGKCLRSKNIALLFEKDSTRTRCAFEVAAYDEGANVTYLSNSHFGSKESIEDSAKVLGRYYDGIQFRGFHHRTVEELAQHAGVPVWNGLTDLFHPTQALADLLTIQEHSRKPFDEMKLVYVGDTANNVATSLMLGAGKMGMNFVGLGPQELFPRDTLIQMGEECAQKSGATVQFSSDMAVLAGADVVYTDVWVSMGAQVDLAERIRLLQPYRVDQAMLAATQQSEALFMHCLPACHDTNTAVGEQVCEDYGLASMEVTDDVFRGPRSVVFDQAENRLHTIKAVMVATIGS